MDTTFGRYRIVGELGRGGMGVVYKAVDPLLDRTLAIKTVNLAEAADEKLEYAARFQQEAKAAAGLSHPNVITIHDVGAEGDIAFMAMEFLQGRELRGLIYEHGPLPVAQAVDIAAQVADGLGYAHERGVIHRDIKPGNIMILESGLVKIMDFGIAHVRSSDVRTKTGFVLGSPKYMSPEQVLGHRADPRCDLFSLGVVLYEMLTGAAPFSGDNVGSLMNQIANATPVPPSRVNRQVPQMLDFITAKALAKKPDERYPNAGDFAADLRECAKRPFPTPLAHASEIADADGKATALKREAETTRRTELQPGASSTPRPLAPNFDSHQATQRLASATGTQRNLAAHAETIRVARTSQTTASAAKTNLGRTAKSRTPANIGWGPYDKLLLGLTVVAAMIVAMIIAFG